MALLQSAFSPSPGKSPSLCLYLNIFCVWIFTMNCILLCVQQCPVSLHNYNHSSLSHGQTTYSVKTFIEFSQNSTKIRRERTIVKNSGWLLLCWCLWEILSVPDTFVCFWLFLEYFRGKLMLFAFLILLLDTKTVLLIYPRDIYSREKINWFFFTDHFLTVRLFWHMQHIFASVVTLVTLHFQAQ